MTLLEYFTIHEWIIGKKHSIETPIKAVIIDLCLVKFIEAVFINLKKTFKTDRKVMVIFLENIGMSRLVKKPRLSRKQYLTVYNKPF